MVIGEKGYNREGQACYMEDVLIMIEEGTMQALKAASTHR